MRDNRILRVLLIVAIGGGLGFLDYKTKVNHKELEVLDLVSEVLIANQKTSGKFPESLKEAGYGNMGDSILSYQKVSDSEFSLAYLNRDFYIDQNQIYHATNPFIGLKLFIWEKNKFIFEYYYLFLVIFAGILISTFSSVLLKENKKKI